MTTSTDVNNFVPLHFKHYYRKSKSLMPMLLGKNLG